MATDTTSNTGSRSRISSGTAPVHNQEGLVGPAIPKLGLSYSHSVVVSFKIDPRHLKASLPNGLVLDSARSSHYVEITTTHFQRSRAYGLPLIPAFNSLTLSTGVRCATDANQKGKFVFRRCVSSNLAAWRIRQLTAEPKVINIKSVCQSHERSHLPSANFLWKSGEALNYLKVKSLSSVKDPLGHNITRWIIEHQSEFALLPSGRKKSSGCAGLAIFRDLQNSTCNAYSVGQASFKCGTKKLFGDEFNKALSRRPSSVFLFCNGKRELTAAESVKRTG